jgi:hypothetical protein
MRRWKQKGNGGENEDMGNISCVRGPGGIGLRVRE